METPPPPPVGCREGAGPGLDSSRRVRLRFQSPGRATRYKAAGNNAPANSRSRADSRSVWASVREQEGEHERGRRALECGARARWRACASVRAARLPRARGEPVRSRSGNSWSEVRLRAATGRATGCLLGTARPRSAPAGPESCAPGGAGKVFFELAPRQPSPRAVSGFPGHADPGPGFPRPEGRVRTASWAAGEGREPGSRLCWGARGLLPWARTPVSTNLLPSRRERTWTSTRTSTISTTMTAGRISTAPRRPARTFGKNSNWCHRPPHRHPGARLPASRTRLLELVLRSRGPEGAPGMRLNPGAIRKLGAGTTPPSFAVTACGAASRPGNGWREW